MPSTNYDQHGSDIQHSFYGRQLGRDVNGMLTGLADYRPATEVVGTTAASTLAKGGTSILSATAPGAYELPAPAANMVGVRKRLFNSSSGNQLAKLVTGNFKSILGTSANTITLVSTGSYIDLEYITTALVAAMLQTTSTSYTALTTTT